MKKDFKEVDITVPKEGRTILMNRYWACAKGVFQRKHFIMGIHHNVIKMNP